MNRYFKRSFEDSYYVFDSEVVSEEAFDEKYDYEGYNVFEDSLSGDKVISLLNGFDEFKDKVFDLFNAKIKEVHSEWLDNEFDLSKSEVERLKFLEVVLEGMRVELEDFFGGVVND